MSFTDEERARIRYHLGYVEVSQVQYFALGLPAAQEPLFMVERAMDVVVPAAEATVRQLIAVLDRVDAQMADDLELLAVEQVDEIAINQTEQTKLERKYRYYVGAVCNCLGVCANPYDRRFAGSNSGLNVGVTH